jgi:hypothetical protein
MLIFESRLIVLAEVSGIIEKRQQIVFPDLKPV